MKKNTKKIFALAATILLGVCVLAGCSSKSDDAAFNSTNGMLSDSYSEMGDILDYESSASDNKDASPGEAENGSGTDVSTNRKFIERVYLNAETKEFDALLEKLTEEIEKVGGYVENSSVSGNSYEYDRERYANFTVRVPSSKSDEFTAFVSENSTVTSKEIDTEDVTLSYVDMESRVSALQTEKATLERLLADAETMTDVITIQDRLTDVIYEIESYQSQLRTYDNLIEYTTISIHIYEVERVTIVEDQTVWGEIATNLKENFIDVGYGLERTFVFLVSSIPYILVFAGYVSVIILIVAFLTKIHKKKSKRKKLTEVKESASKDKGAGGI